MRDERKVDRDATRWLLIICVAIGTSFTLNMLLSALGDAEDGDGGKTPQNAVESVSQAPVDATELDRRLETAAATIEEARAYLQEHANNP